MHTNIFLIIELGKLINSIAQQDPLKKKGKVQKKKLNEKNVKQKRLIPKLIFSWLIYIYLNLAKIYKYNLRVGYFYPNIFVIPTFTR